MRTLLSGGALLLSLISLPCAASDVPSSSGNPPVAAALLPDAADFRGIGIGSPRLRWAGTDWGVQAGAVDVPEPWQAVQLGNDAAKVRFHVESDPRWHRVGQDNAEQRRSELADTTPLSYGTSYWFAYSFQINEWDGTSTCALGQVSTVRGAVRGSPILALRLTAGNQITITTRNGDQQGVGIHQYTGPAPALGTIHDIVYNVVYDDDHGTLRVWLDGNPIVDKEQNVQMGTRGSAPYFKFGAYCSIGTAAPVTITYANYAPHAERSLMDRTRQFPGWPPG